MKSGEHSKLKKAGKEVIITNMQTRQRYKNYRHHNASESNSKRVNDTKVKNQVSTRRRNLKLYDQQDLVNMKHNNKSSRESKDKTSKNSNTKDTWSNVNTTPDKKMLEDKRSFSYQDCKFDQGLIKSQKRDINLDCNSKRSDTAVEN